MAQDNKDKISKLYNTFISEGYDMESEAEFRKNLADPKKRKAAYDALVKDGYEMEAYDLFEQNVGYSHPSISTQNQEAPEHDVAPTQDNLADFAQTIAGVNQTVAESKQTQERIKNMGEYHKKTGLQLGKSVEGGYRYNPETQDFEQTYLTATGGKTTSKIAADTENNEYRKFIERQANATVSGQLRQAYREREDLERRLAERGKALDVEALKPSWRDMPRGGGGAIHTFNSSTTNGRLADGEWKKLFAAKKMLDERIATLEDQRDRDNGVDVGFWRGFFGTVGKQETWDMGMSAMTKASALMTHDLNFSENEEVASKLMMEQAAKQQEAERAYGGNADFWNRAGVMTGEMLPFMLDFMTFNVAGEGFNVFGKGATKGAAKLTEKVGESTLKKYIQKEGLRGMASGVKDFVKSEGLKEGLSLAMKQDVAPWAIKALGMTADELLIKAPLMTNTVQMNKTAADIVERKLGDVVTNEDGQLDFENDKTWGSAIWQGEANAIIENYSEMFGAHVPEHILNNGAKELAGIFGAKRLSGVLAKANSSNFFRVMDGTAKFMQKNLGMSDYVGEVAEEYYGQLWRTMLNLDDAYRVNEDGSRTNLLFDGQFHGDIWGGMALSMGLMNGGKAAFSAANYSRMKHNVSKADRRASEVFTQETWEPLRNLIDVTTNDNIGQLAENIVNDATLTNEEKAAAMSYMETSLNFRGYNLGELAKQRGATENEDAKNINASWMDGYETTSAQEMTDAKNMHDYQRMKVAQSLGVADPEGIDDVIGDPIEYISAQREEGVSDEELQPIIDYVNAKAVYDGIQQRISDDIDSRVDESNAMIDTRVNRGDGLIHPATMKVEDRQVYIVNGNLQMNEDGTMIDRENSDESVVVRDAETGAIEMVAAEHVFNVAAPIDANEEKLIAEQQIREQGQREAENRLNGTISEFNAGDTHVLTEDDGRQLTIQLVQDQETGLVDNGDGTVNVTANGKTIMPIPVEEIQRLVDNTNRRRIADFEAERQQDNAAVRQQREEEAAMRPQYNLNDTIVIRLEDGAEVEADVFQEENEDGAVGVVAKDGVTPIYEGRVSGMIPRDVLDGMNASVEISAPQNGTQGNGDQIDDVNEMVGHDMNVETNDETAGSEDIEPTENIPALARIEKDEKGEPLYEQADPELAWDALVESTEGDAETAKVIADSMVEDLKAELKKAEKLKVQGATPSEKLASAKLNKAAKEQIQSKLAGWQKIAGTEQRRKAAIDAENRRKAQEAAAALAEQRAAERAAQEEAERKEREALNGVPDWTQDIAKNARARGYRRVTGTKVDRQQPIVSLSDAIEGKAADGEGRTTALVGKPVTVKFDKNNMPEGNAVVIEASTLQPSHLQGQRNPAHFIDEAQPKERNDQASVHSAREIAENIRPEEITGSVTAYTGAPSVNARGEVIQGNNRSDALRYMWQNPQSEQAQQYKQYLKDHADEFGLKAEDIEQMESPVLVNMLDVDDETAIGLGQFVAQDTESGGIERIKPKNIAERMKGGSTHDNMQMFAKMLLDSQDEEDSLSQLVDKNGAKVLDWLNGRGFITPTQYQSAFDSKGNLTGEAVNDLKGILYQHIFQDGSTRLEEMFNSLPAKVQRAILATAFRDFDSKAADRMIGEIQQSIMAYFEIEHSDEGFASAKNLEEARRAVENWKRQYIFDDATGESVLPVDKYSNFALLLAAVYKGQTQRGIQAMFNELYDVVQGAKEDNLFETFDKTPKPLAEAIKQVIGDLYNIDIEYNGQTGNVLLGGHAETGEEAQPGSDGSIASGESAESGAESPDSTGRTESDEGESLEPATESQGTDEVGEANAEDGTLDDETAEERRVLADAIAEAEAQVNTEPTEAQKEAGNYKKGHVKVDGFDVTIEQPKGSVRSGKDANGREWSQTMNNTYGYIRGTEGVDGDHIDVFLSSFPELGDIFVIDQYNEDGTFDEHKVMYGYADAESAMQDYLANYEKGWEKTRRLDITGVTHDEFKKWIDSSHRKTKPFAEYKSVKAIESPAIESQGTEGNGKPSLLDVVKTLYEKGKEAASKLYQMKFFDVAQTPDFMKEIGLTGDKFTVRYGVIARHFGKDSEHDLPSTVWEQLPEALQKPFAITKYFVDEEKKRQKGYRLYTTLQLPNGSYVVVSAEVKNAGKDIEVNAINTVFGRDAISKTHDEVVYIGENITPEQQALLNGNNPRQYPDVREQNAFDSNALDNTTDTGETHEGNGNDTATPENTAVSKGKGTKLSDTEQEKGGESAETASNNDAEQKSKAKNPSGNKLVTDEKYQELLARMKAKMGQLNVGIDPEMLEIGAGMTVYHLEKGVRKFADYAKAMIADLGDAIRPYLKSFYSYVRYDSDVIENGWNADMDSDAVVADCDIANFDKPTTDAMATAEHVVKEKKAKAQMHESKKAVTEKKAKERVKKQQQEQPSLFDFSDDEKPAEPAATVIEPAKDTQGAEESTILKQYNELKKKHPDATLLFRVGDFYETYSTDAERLCNILGLTLVNREDTMMAGFPSHSLDTYLPKLVRAGLRVAICDQLEDQYLKKTVKRGGMKPEKELSGDSEQWQQRKNDEASLVEELRVEIAKQATAIQRDGEESVKPMRMADVKKMAKKYDTLKNYSDTDLQELVELAMTNATRAVAARFINGNATEQRAGYERVVNLYKAQPSLNARDSSRIEKQQYSTPTPFGYVMGQFVLGHEKAKKGTLDVLEPSAGNGALTICFDPQSVHVNDIDERRFANLTTLGYKAVTSHDGLLPFPGKYDAVLTNPPFGTTTEKSLPLRGNNNVVWHISSLEGLMSINALESMKDDGRAAIVIGGNSEYRENGVLKPKDMKYFSYLCSHYNVVDVINLDGSMYSRNGTTYPVRIILVNGRKKGDLQQVIPPVQSKARAEKVTTFEELYNRVQDDILQLQQAGKNPVGWNASAKTIDGGSRGGNRQESDRQNVGVGAKSVRTGTVDEGGRNEELAVVHPESRPGGRGSDEQPTKQGAINGVGNDNRGYAGSLAVVQGGRADRGRQPDSHRSESGERVGRESGGNESVRPTSESSNSGERLSVALTDEKVVYPNRSQSMTLMSVVPANQAQVLADSLEKIGDVDQFLVNELGYSDKDELFSHLAAEQVDSVALAIKQMNSGNAFIIGDMTGVGKGRQAAALIRYAVRQGKKPVFFTQKASLFSDIYRDLGDIGSSNLRPFIMASDDKEHTPWITDAEGKVVYKLPTAKERKRVYDYIKNYGTLPDEYDYAVTCYSQIQNGTKEYEAKDGTIQEKAKKYDKKGVSANDKAGQERRDVMWYLSRGNYLILDESHTVSGTSGMGGYMQMLIQEHPKKVAGVTFLSATFAKRADNMPIYAMRTAIAESGLKSEEMIDAVARGGVTLQEIMSKQLVQSGQMIRRERDFNGVTIDWMQVDEEADKKQRVNFDEVAGIFSAIRAFQSDYINPMVEEMSKDMANEGGYAGLKQGTEAMGVKNTPFASKMYNLVNQLLFALKADAVADRVIWNLQHGFKPVISFTNTMEGFLDEAPKDTPMDKIPNFSLTLMRALDGVMRYQTTDANGNKTYSQYSVSQLPAEGQAVYEDIRKRITNLTADLSISPMDAIKMRIEEAGYTVAEITGRSTELTKDENGKYIVRNRTDKDKKAAARGFNNGTIDVLLINKSGSTGISLHSSPKFKDQRQRVMVFAQFQSDINDEVQMRGRIDRTGQVFRGKYEYIMSSIPAEQRLQMMFKAKLKSLDANTTSSQKSKFNEMEVVDYLNKYGDEVTWAYMKEHPELEDKLGDPLKMFTDGEDRAERRGKDNTRPAEDCAAKIARYLPFLPVAEQEEVFKEITEAYAVKIQLLNDAGENDLEITTMPLKAETKSKKIWKAGTNPDSGNAFADNTYLEEVEVDVLKKPMKSQEVKDYAERLTDGQPYEEWKKSKREQIREHYAGKISALVERLNKATQERADKEREKYVKSATKARQDGKNEWSDEELQHMADLARQMVIDKANETAKKQLAAIENRRDAILEILSQLTPLEPLSMPLNLGEDNIQTTFMPSYGTFVGFKFNKDFSPSSSTAVFATLDGRRKVELSLSQKKAIDHIMTATVMNGYDLRNISMETWDSMVPTKSRKTAYIITGNLMQALVDTAKDAKTKGYLVSYSTIDGETRQGVLMPDRFQPSDLRSSAPISSRLEDIRRGDYVESEDGKVNFIKDSWLDRYYLRVPKSKQQGGKYFEDAELRRLVEDGEFRTKGNYMQGMVSGKNLPKVVDVLSKIGVKVLQESQLNDASQNNREEQDADGRYREADQFEDGQVLKITKSEDNTYSVEGLHDGFSSTAALLDAFRTKYPQYVATIFDNVNRIKVEPWSKYLKPARGKQAEYNKRQQKRAQEAVSHWADKLHLDNVEVVTDTSTLKGKRAKSRGWYDPKTGKIVVVLPNHTNVQDVIRTMLHEGVAHLGLRKMFGEHFENFIDNVYRNVTEDIKDAIDSKAYALFMADGNKRSWDECVRVSTEEYMADIAEDTDFERLESHKTFWQKVKNCFLNMLIKVGIRLDNKLTDNDLKYILWRSYQNLADEGRYKNVFDIADDVVKDTQMRKKLGIYGPAAESQGTDRMKFADGEAGYEDVNRRFNEQLAKYESGQMPSNSFFELGNPVGVLSYFLPDMPVVMRQRVLRKGIDKKHNISLASLQNMPKQLSEPIFVFQRTEDTIGILTEMKDNDGKNVCVAIELNRSMQNGGNILEVNDIRSIHGRDSENVIQPIINNGTLRWVDKEKGLRWLSSASQQAQQEIVKEDLDSAAKIVENFENPKGTEENMNNDVLFRDGDPEMRERAMAAHIYEQRVKKGMYQAQEALQDSMLGLREAMEAVLKASGSKSRHIEDVDGFENPYIGENRLSSVNQAEAQAFARTLFKPLLDEVAKLAKDERQRKTLIEYMMAKHGLERNEFMAKRDAVNSLEGSAEKKELDEAERVYSANPLDLMAKARLDAAQIAYDTALASATDEFSARDYAGLTALTGEDETVVAESIAQIMVDDYEADHDTGDLWDKVNAVNDATLSKLYDSGLMTKANYDYIKSMYTFYIPLRGFDETTSADAYAYLNSKKGSFNAPIKKAEGRKSVADDPLAQMQSMAESAILQGNRNKLVKQRMLNFALNHPSDLVSVSELWLQYDDVTDEWNAVFPDNIEESDTPEEVEQKMADFEEKMKHLAEAEPDKYKRGKDAVGIPYRVVENSQLHQHQVVVKRGGRDFVLTINGNPRAAQALNGQTNPDNDISGAIGAILRKAESLNRWLSANYTTRNPDFVISNFIRDALYSNSMSWIKERPNYAFAYNRNFVANMLRMKSLFAKYRKGTLDKSDRTEAMFEQFMMNGGETGYAIIRDIDAHKTQILRELKRANSRVSIAKLWSLLGERLDEYNRAVENCARFSAFVTSREFGRSMDRAIWDAKEISVNFNKKGSGSKFMGSTGQTKSGNAAAFVSGLGRGGYVFWNAAIQGTTNFGRQAMRHPAKSLTAMASLFLLGAVIAAIGAGDGDDDDKNSYYNLPEYTRRSNIMFRVGDKWVAIPLPVEYRAIYGMGELMASAMSGKEHLANDELAMAIAGQVSQLMPIDMLEGGGGMKAFVPSYIKPFYEVHENVGWTGTPIYKDTPYNKEMPEWTKAYKNANKHIVNLAKVTNELTGGDEYTKGRIDINPAQVEYLLNGYFGGINGTIDKMVKMGETFAGEREFDTRSFLLLNRVLKNGDERTEYRAINKEYMRAKHEYETLKTRLKKYENDTGNGIFDYSEKIATLEYSPEYERYEIFDDYRGDIDALYRELKETFDDEERKEIESEINELKKECVEELNATRSKTAGYRGKADAGK